MERLQIDLSQPQAELKDTTQEAKLLSEELEGVKQDLNGLGDTKVNIDMDRSVDRAEKLAENLGHVTRVAAGLAGGVEVVQGALNLMGVESEDAEKAIQKMMAVMEITNGFSAIGDGIESFVKLGKAIKTSTLYSKLFSAEKKKETVVVNANTFAQKANATAMKASAIAARGLKAALISSGIGAIMVGIGYAIEKASSALDNWNNKKVKGEADEAFRTRMKAQSDVLNDIQNASESELKLQAGLITEAEKIQLDSDKIVEKIKQKKSELKDLTTDIRDLESSIAGRQNVGMTTGVDDGRLARMKDNKKAMDQELQELENEYNINLAKLQKIDKLEGYKREAENNRKREADKEERKKLMEENRKLFEQEASELRSQLEGIASLDMSEYDKAYNDITKWYTDLEKEIRSYFTGNELNDALNVIIEERTRRTEELDKQFKSEVEDFKMSLMDEYDAEIYTAQKNRRENRELNERFYTEGRISKEEYTQALLDIEYKYNDAVAAANEKRGDAILNADTELFIKRRERLIQEYRSGNEYYKFEHDIDPDKSLEALSANENHVRAAERNLELLRQEYALMMEYRDSVIAAGKDSAEVENMIAENRIQYMYAEKELMQAKIDSMNSMLDTFNSAAGVIIASGDAISSEWNNVFSNLQAGLNQIGQSLKTNGKGWQTYTQVVGSAFNVLGSTFGAIADEQNENTKEGFEKQKKFETAAAVMNTLGGIINVITSVWNPVNAWLTPWGQAALSASMSTALAVMGGIQIKKIKNTKFEGSGSGDVSSPNISAMASMQPAIAQANIVEGASIEGATQDTRVYVSETDISRVQNRVNVTETEAKY